LLALKLGSSCEPLPGFNIKPWKSIRRIGPARIYLDILGLWQILVKEVDEDILEGLFRFFENPPFNYSEGVDLFDSPYDWQRNIRIAATDLAETLKTIALDKDDGKAVVIGYSMGGLVSRYALVKIDDVRDRVATYVSLGTPHAGTTAAYMAVRKPIIGAPVSEEVLAQLTPNHCGYFQQMPNQLWFNRYRDLKIERPVDLPVSADKTTADFLFVRGPFAAGIGATEFLRSPEQTYSENSDSRLENQALVEDAKIFWQELGAWDSMGTIPQEVQAHLIVGYGIWTAKWISYGTRPLPGQIGNPLFKLGWMNGDRTVNLLSQDALTGSNVRKYYVWGSAGAQNGNTEGTSFASHRDMPVNTNATHRILEWILKDSPDEAYKVTYRVKKLNSLVPQDDVPVTDSLPGDPLSVGLAGIWRVTAYSPSSVRIHVFDDEGRHLGPTPDGLMDLLPGTDYVRLGDTDNVLLPADRAYRVLFESLGHESFVDLDIEILRPNGSLQQAVFFRGVEIGPHTQGEVSYDTEMRQFSRWRIDLDGNGTVDRLVQPVATWPPVLALERLGNKVSISWPASAADFVLQMTESLAPLSWIAVTNNVVIVGDRNTLAVETLSSSAFYRLCRP
jgi:pimeloyl-ACP methyl ester carboxylesterase